MGDGEKGTGGAVHASERAKGFVNWPNKKKEKRERERPCALPGACELAGRVHRRTLDDRPRGVAVDVFLGRVERKDAVKRERGLSAAVHRHILARAIEVADELAALPIAGARGDNERAREGKGGGKQRVHEGRGRLSN